MPDIRINALATTAAAPAQDDFLEIDGATNGTRKLRANAIQEWDSTRAVLGYLYSDGATSGRGQVQTPGARGNLAGAAQASWVGWVDVPTSNPTGSPAGIAYVASTATSPYPSNWSMAVQISTSGTLELFAFSNNGFNDRRQSVWFVFRSTYSGQRVWLDVRFTAGSSKPSVFVNGVDVTTSFSDSSTGTTIPSWLDSSLQTTFALTGFAWPAGIAPLGCWLNAHLTNAESESWRISGRPPVWVALGGSRSPSYSSNFSAGLDGWSESAGGQSVLTGNIDAIAGVDDTLRISRGTTGVVQIGNISANLTATSPAYGYELIFDYYLESASGITAIYLGGVGNAQSNTITPTEGAWQTGVRLVTSLFTTSRYLAANGALAAGKSLYIKNVVIRPIGALSLPAVQPINVVEDITALGGNQARLVGMTPVPLSPAPVSVIEIPARSFTGGTYYEILGGAITGARKRRIVSVTGNTSAAANLHLGTTSGGTQIFGSPTVGISGDFDIGNASFTTRIVPANASLHVMFSATTTASLHIHLTDL